MLTDRALPVETGGEGGSHADLALLDLLGADPQEGVGRVTEAGGDGDRVVTVSEGGASGPVAEVVEDDDLPRPEGLPARLAARLNTS